MCMFLGAWLGAGPCRGEVCGFQTKKTETHDSGKNETAHEEKVQQTGLRVIQHAVAVFVSLSYLVSSA